MTTAAPKRARSWLITGALLVGATAALLLLARGLQWLSELQIGHLTR